MGRIHYPAGAPAGYPVAGYPVSGGKIGRIAGYHLLILSCWNFGGPFWVKNFEKFKKFKEKLN